MTLRFACPECFIEVVGADLRVRPGQAGPTHRSAPTFLACRSCGREYEQRDGVWRFLTAERASALEPFIRQYRAVRDRDGHRRAAPPEFYRMLPTVAPTDPHAAEWMIRRETYGHLLQHVLASGPRPLRVLDVGAGSGWLSHRLATLGHHVIALDILDDELDGLGAAKHYGVPALSESPVLRQARDERRVEWVQADFDALPFVPDQFDLIVFNGSLHYAPEPDATLGRAHRLLAPEGSLVVMDSPLFGADRDGAAMVDEKVRHFNAACGIDHVVHGGAGYLTFARLGALAASLRLQAQFVPSRGSFAWRMKRHVGRLRLGRAPAAFGLWVAR